MLTVLHGDNLVRSRQALTEFITQVQPTADVIRLDAKSLQFATLESALRANSLFGNTRTVVIEGLHSLPKSKKQSELIALTIAQATATNVLLWENRSLTKTMLKPFIQANADISEFKLSKTLFSWLDMIDGTRRTYSGQAQLARFHEVVQQEDIWVCLAMLSYRVRQLLLAKTGGVIPGAPFMAAKLQQQADRFSLPQLLRLHEQLYLIDKNVKSSATVLDLRSTLDLLLLNM